MVRFNMFRINTEQFAILENQLPTGEVTLNSELLFKHSVEGKSIATEISFSFATAQSKFIVLKVSCEFSIHPDDWEIFKEGNTIVIKKNLLEYFVVQTIGTARGILHCKTEGTPFNIFVLPPINVTELVTEDMIIQVPNL